MTLEEARRRFPIGTKFNPAHMACIDDISIVTNSNFVENEDGNIFSMTDEGDFSADFDESKYGNHDYCRVIYYTHTGKVADILELPKPIIYEVW